MAPFPPSWRWAGLLLAASAFLASNLFLQVSTSVMAVLLTPESEFSATKPYVLERLGRIYYCALASRSLLPALTAKTTAAVPAPAESIESASGRENSSAGNIINPKPADTNGVTSYLKVERKKVK